MLACQGLYEAPDNYFRVLKGETARKYFLEKVWFLPMGDRDEGARQQPDVLKANVAEPRRLSWADQKSSPLPVQQRGLGNTRQNPSQNGGRVKSLG